MCSMSVWESVLVSVIVMVSQDGAQCEVRPEILEGSLDQLANCASLRVEANASGDQKWVPPHSHCRDDGD
jgi:hypothetical protein